jgi:hypothetical protein
VNEHHKSSSFFCFTFLKPELIPHQAAIVSQGGSGDPEVYVMYFYSLQAGGSQLL